MVSKLGAEVLTALEEQSWTVAVGADEVLAASPLVGAGWVFPVELIEHEENEFALRLLLLQMVVLGGLVWPWPPEIEDDLSDLIGE